MITEQTASVEEDHVMEWKAPEQLLLGLLWHRSQESTFNLNLLDEVQKTCDFLNT